MPVVDPNLETVETTLRAAFGSLGRGQKTGGPVLSVVSVASISLVGALLSALALRRREGDQARLERLEGLLDSFQLYAGPDR
jgi:hypothetical protein